MNRSQTRELAFKLLYQIEIQKEINDEDELYDLCIDNGWNLQWYEKYKKHLNKWTSY